MLVLRGLREAFLLVVAVVTVAAAGVGIWVAASGGPFVTRFGLALMIVGALVGVTGDLTLSRIGTMEARSIFGIPPEQEGAGGGRVLTGVGIFLFVSVPLMIVGAALSV